jgi:hypothetical protein
MGTNLVVRRRLKNGENATYYYTKIGESQMDVSTYMYKKLKKRRQEEREKKGKVLLNEIPESIVNEMKMQRERGASYSSLARLHGLSRYFVAKSLKQPQVAVENL